MDPIIARKTWRTAEPIHGMIYFVPEAATEYRHSGVVDRMMGYFGSRSAPMTCTRPSDASLRKRPVPVIVPPVPTPDTKCVRRPSVCTRQ